MLRILGGLLRYPDAELIGALSELGAVLAAAPELGASTRAGLAALLEELRSTPLLELEERYVALFDRTRGLSLHLHEHVHGEARERGSAMSVLAELYARAGLELLPGELPDYLPVLCEFLSLRPPAEMQALLGDAAAVLRRLQGRLEQRGSAYAAVLAGLGELASAPATAAVDPDPGAAELPDLAALDSAWEDAPVLFGASGEPAACASSRPLQITTSPRAAAPAAPRSAEES